MLEHGVRLAAHGGLPAASIGALAATLGMSKSAVFAHFGSKTGLDQALVAAAVARFERHVVAPAAAAPPGVARLAALSEAWLTRAGAHDQALHLLTGACPLAFPAPRDAILAWRRAWRAALAAQAQHAVTAGELAASTSPDVVAFELDALLLAALRDAECGETTAAGRARYAIEHLLRRRAVADAPAGART